MNSDSARAERFLRHLEPLQGAMEAYCRKSLHDPDCVDYPVLDVEMDRVLASHQGVTVDDVMKNLVSATNSSINFDPAFWIDESNGNHYFMGVQYREEDINSLDTLRNIPISGSNSEGTVPLKNVSTFEQTTGPSVINHHNITRATDIYANVLPGCDVGSIVTAMEKRLEASPELQLVSEQLDEGQVYNVAGPEFEGKGYAVEMQGEVKSMRDSFAQFSQGLMIAVILVYLVMVVQFRSFLDPFIILLTVPLGFVGVIELMALTGTNLSIMAFMGIIMMVGIVVEYSIVLIDFANRRLAEGLTVQVEQRDIENTIEMPGTVEGIETADLYSKVAGYLEKISVDIGDSIEQGQVLVQLSIPEMEKEQIRSWGRRYPRRSQTRDSHCQSPPPCPMIATQSICLRPCSLVVRTTCRLPLPPSKSAKLHRDSTVPK